MPFFSNILTCFAGAANAESKKEPGHAATRVGPSAAAFFHGSYQSGQHELPGCPSSSCTHAETVVSSGIFACQSNGRGSQGPGRGREVGCVHRVHDEAELEDVYQSLEYDFPSLLAVELAHALAAQNQHEKATVTHALCETGDKLVVGQQDAHPKLLIRDAQQAHLLAPQQVGELYEWMLQDGPSSGNILKAAISCMPDPRGLLEGIGQLRYIGKGAYGAVYSGMWHGKRVAVKFVPGQNLDMECKAVREALLSRALHHPYVVSTFVARLANIDSQALENINELAADGAERSSASDLFSWRASSEPTSVSPQAVLSRRSSSTMTAELMQPLNSGMLIPTLQLLQPSQLRAAFHRSSPSLDCNRSITGALGVTPDLNSAGLPVPGGCSTLGRSRAAATTLLMQRGRLRACTSMPDGVCLTSTGSAGQAPHLPDGMHSQSDELHSTSDNTAMLQTVPDQIGPQAEASSGRMLGELMQHSGPLVLLGGQLPRTPCSEHAFKQQPQHLMQGPSQPLVGVGASGGSEVEAGSASLSPGPKHVADSQHGSIMAVCSQHSSLQASQCGLLQLYPSSSLVNPHSSSLSQAGTHHSMCAGGLGSEGIDLTMHMDEVQGNSRLPSALQYGMDAETVLVGPSEPGACEEAGSSRLPKVAEMLATFQTMQSEKGQAAHAGTCNMQLEVAPAGRPLALPGPLDAMLEVSSNSSGTQGMVFAYTGMVTGQAGLPRPSGTRLSPSGMLPKSASPGQLGEAASKQAAMVHGVLHASHAPDLFAFASPFTMPGAGHSIMETASLQLAHAAHTEAAAAHAAAIEAAASRGMDVSTIALATSESAAHSSGFIQGMQDGQPQAGSSGAGLACMGHQDIDALLASEQLVLPTLEEMNMSLISSGSAQNAATIEGVVMSPAGLGLAMLNSFPSVGNTLISVACAGTGSSGNALLPAAAAGAAAAASTSAGAGVLATAGQHVAVGKVQQNRPPAWPMGQPGFLQVNHACMSHGSMHADHAGHLDGGTLQHADALHGVPVHAQRQPSSRHSAPVLPIRMLTVHEQGIVPDMRDPHQAPMLEMPYLGTGSQSGTHTALPSCASASAVGSAFNPHTLPEGASCLSSPAAVAAAGQLHGICSTLSVRPGGCLVALIMEHMNMGNLDEFTKRDPFDPHNPKSGQTAKRALLSIAQQVAQGLEYLHGHGYIHGDLKPANVLLKSDRVHGKRTVIAKVADFGTVQQLRMDSSEQNTIPHASSLFHGGAPFQPHLAVKPSPQPEDNASNSTATITTTSSACADPRVIDQRRSQGSALPAAAALPRNLSDDKRHTRRSKNLATEEIGTVAYSAPEALTLTPCQASDVWSFGLLLHHMATGTRPHSSLEIGQIMFGVVHQGLKPAWPADRHTHLRNVYNACTAAEAHMRPTFSELVLQLAALDELLRGKACQQQQEVVVPLPVQQQVVVLP